MSQLSKASSSSFPGGGNNTRSRGERGRGIPKFCRCGEEAVIRTSGTAKNPGRLFYCCPYGSEGDKYHLFTWTDERVVEEVEDLKSIVSELKYEISDARSEIQGMQEQIQSSKLLNELTRNRNICCCIL